MFDLWVSALLAALDCDNKPVLIRDSKHRFLVESIDLEQCFQMIRRLVKNQWYEQAKGIL